MKKGWKPNRVSSLFPVLLYIVGGPEPQDTLKPLWVTSSVILIFPMDANMDAKNIA